jgi:hypothetical protein
MGLGLGAWVAWRLRTGTILRQGVRFTSGWVFRLDPAGPIEVLHRVHSLERHLCRFRNV